MLLYLGRAFLPMIEKEVAKIAAFAKTNFTIYLPFYDCLFASF